MLQLQKSTNRILTACGGRGNCIVRIVHGDAAINTMDRMWFSEEQPAERYRLDCQVYTREPITVEMPDKACGISKGRK